MIQKFDLISGEPQEVKSYIENLDNFKCWQLGKDYFSQVKNLLKRECNFKHIGPITYQGEDETGETVIHAAFIAITYPNRLLDDNRV